jgi:tRNA dimethylallyltransferase
VSRGRAEGEEKEKDQPPIFAIVGPTGVGKTDLALRLARRLQAEIVNADSRQVYRGLDIGSAKPKPEERISVPHHLYDVVDPNEPFDCARYRELAGSVIEEIRSRGRAVVLVGGTGLYLKVLRYGLCSGPPRDPMIRARLTATESARPGTLHELLQTTDPAAAERLHPHDSIRLIRALEVHELTGKPLSAWQAEHDFRTTELDLQVVGLNMERPSLYERINRRCEVMVAGGLVEEVQGLWASGFGPDPGPMRSIGYREVGYYLHGRCDLTRAVAEMAQASRRLAKRQLTWFRADPSIRWYDVSRQDVEAVCDNLCLGRAARNRR